MKETEQLLMEFIAKYASHWIGAEEDFSKDLDAIIASIPTPAPDELAPVQPCKPDGDALSSKAIDLLKWAMCVCDDIQKYKTYGNRFPETASLGAAIGDYLNAKNN